MIINLSPYEKDRIVPQEFGQTEMGRDLLAEDYILKQITASLIYPESQLGKEFWKKVYAKAQAKYGTTNIPVNTFNKVWIVPEKAVVYENGGVAFVLENHLKVMLEQDYLSMSKHTNNNSLPFEGRAREGVIKGISPPPNLPLEGGGTNALGSQIIREIVIPALTKEVNEGKNFAQLRQVFYSLILATWYKKKIKDSILNKVYSNRKKIMGLSPTRTPTRGHVQKRTTKNVSPSRLPTNEPLKVKASQVNPDNDVEFIYQQYLQAFKKGVYNYIKEESDPLSGQAIPRKYFSGGCIGSVSKAMTIKDRAQVTLKDFAMTGETFAVDVDTKLINDKAMLNTHGVDGGDTNDLRDLSLAQRSALKNKNALLLEEKMKRIRSEVVEEYSKRHLNGERLDEGQIFTDDKLNTKIFVKVFRDRKDRKKFYKIRPVRGNLSNLEELIRLIVLKGLRGIPQLIKWGVQENGDIWMHLEGIEDSKSLDKCLREGQFDLADRLEIAIKIAENLESMQLAGMGHYDIKPQNIAVNPRKEVLLIDFDISDVLNTFLGNAGTKGYKAPEEEKDERSDVFSLGVMFRDMFEQSKDGVIWQDMVELIRRMTLGEWIDIDKRPYLSEVINQLKAIQTKFKMTREKFSEVDGWKTIWMATPLIDNKRDDPAASPSDFMEIELAQLKEAGIIMEEFTRDKEIVVLGFSSGEFEKVYEACPYAKRYHLVNYSGHVIESEGWALWNGALVKRKYSFLGDRIKIYQEDAENVDKMFPAKSQKIVIANGIFSDDFSTQEKDVRTVRAIKTILASDGIGVIRISVTVGTEYPVRPRVTDAVFKEALTDSKLVFEFGAKEDFLSPMIVFQMDGTMTSNKIPLESGNRETRFVSREMIVPSNGMVLDDILEALRRLKAFPDTPEGVLQYQQQIDELDLRNRQSKDEHEEQSYQFFQGMSWDQWAGVFQGFLVNKKTSIYHYFHFLDQRVAAKSFNAFIEESSKTDKDSLLLFFSFLGNLLHAERVLEDVIAKGIKGVGLSDLAPIREEIAFIRVFQDRWRIHSKATTASPATRLVGEETDRAMIDRNESGVHQLIRIKFLYPLLKAAEMPNSAVNFQEGWAMPGIAGTDNQSNPPRILISNWLEDKYYFESKTDIGVISDIQMAYFIAHEMAHIKRRHLVNSLENEIEATKDALVILLNAGYSLEEIRQIVVPFILKIPVLHDQARREGALIISEAQDMERRHTHLYDELADAAGKNLDAVEKIRAIQGKAPLKDGAMTVEEQALKAAKASDSEHVRYFKMVLKGLFNKGLFDFSPNQSWDLLKRFFYGRKVLNMRPNDITKVLKAEGIKAESLTQGFSQTMPFNEDSYDDVIDINAVEGENNDAQAKQDNYRMFSKELKRILKEGGRFHLGTYTENALLIKALDEQGFERLDFKIEGAFDYHVFINHKVDPQKLDFTIPVKDALSCIQKSLQEIDDQDTPVWFFGSSAKYGVRWDHDVDLTVAKHGIGAIDFHQNGNWGHMFAQKLVKNLFRGRKFTTDFQDLSFSEFSEKNRLDQLRHGVVYRITANEVTEIRNEKRLGRYLAVDSNAVRNKAKPKKPSGPGGIDLNPAQMSMKVKKEGEDFKFEFNGQTFDAAQVSGATFTIRAMTPVADLPQLLGLDTNGFRGD